MHPCEGSVGIYALELILDWFLISRDLSLEIHTCNAVYVIVKSMAIEID